MGKNWLTFNKAILLLFILSIFVIIRVVLTQQEYPMGNEAEIVLDKLTNGNGVMSLLSSGELIEDKLRNFDEMEYNEVKDALNIKSDFCVYFEDIDGNLVKIDGVNLGIGSDNIYINGEPCR